MPQEEGYRSLLSVFFKAFLKLLFNFRVKEWKRKVITELEVMGLNAKRKKYLSKEEGKLRYDVLQSS